MFSYEQDFKERIEQTEKLIRECEDRIRNEEEEKRRLGERLRELNAIYKMLTK